MNEAGYKYIKTVDDYEFYTAYGAAYAVYFRTASEYFENVIVKNFIYRVDIVQIAPGPYNNPDFRISITIAVIILDIFDADNRNVLFYICDPVDGKLRARKRIFSYWYRLFRNADFRKINTVIYTNNLVVNLTFIFLKNNAFAYDIPLIIEAAKDRFNNK